MATFAVCFASASAAWGHPGHDAHAPQQGLSHWFLSPIHCITIVCGIAITAIFVLRYGMMARSVKYETTFFFLVAIFRQKLVFQAPVLKI